MPGPGASPRQVTVHHWLAEHAVVGNGYLEPAMAVLTRPFVKEAPISRISEPARHVSMTPSGPASQEQHALAIASQAACVRDALAVSATPRYRFGGS